VTSPSLLDIETAQNIEGCTFDDRFRRLLAATHNGHTTVSQAIATEIHAALMADNDREIRPKTRWQRLFGTPPYEDARFRVLRNQPGLTSPTILDELSGRTCALRMIELVEEPIVIRSSEDLLAIHHRLFGDVFGWAGQFRFVNLSRQGIDFAPVPALNHHLEISTECLRKSMAQVAEEGHAHVETVCQFLAEFLWCHPFRDGNGRTAMAVIMSITTPGALSTVSWQEWYAASAASLQVPDFPDPEPWAPLVQRMLEY
jgi:cell filamentation protein